MLVALGSRLCEDARLGPNAPRGMMYEGFAIEEVLSENARSSVCRARRTATPFASSSAESVVLKVLQGASVCREYRARYRHEFETLQSVRSSHVIRAHELRAEEGTTFLVLEDFGATSLDRFAARQPLSTEQTLRIALQICSALAAIHAAQIVHNDIKPANIVYCPESGEAKLIDFGASTSLVTPVSTEASQREPLRREFTLAYVSPEQTGRMNRSIDHRTDLYSLGVTLYELLTLRAPFTGSDTLEWVHAHLARRPKPPAEVDSKIPRALSDVVMKLLEKNPEDRYRSAIGVHADLERCLALGSTDRVSHFELGRDDVLHAFSMPHKLYGRGWELARLAAAFERTVNGPCELVLVSGYSGVGKTSLIREFQVSVSHRRGYFISGKFDQLRRSVPYAAITEAFHELVQQLLCEPEPCLAQWRRDILGALGEKARALFDVIPELERLLGPQPDVPELGLIETQNRFNLLFGKFLDVLCRPEHPLVLFIDDLQWIDSASLRLMAIFVPGDERRNLLVIGTYRDNEVDAAHPLKRFLEGRRAQQHVFEDIALAPLTLPDLAQLCADVLHRSAHDVEPLVELLQQKTDGNPFFVNQFLHALHADGVLIFDPHARHFTWRPEAIRERSVTENVGDLLARRLSSLSPECLHTVHLAACIGNQFDLRTLAWICDVSEEATYAQLLPALNAGFVLPTSGLETTANDVAPTLVHRQFRFLHDRVQQAAYDSEDVESRQRSHLRIGRRLLQQADGDEPMDHIFATADHLNTARELVTSDEQSTLARLNLLAGRLAKRANAYGAASSYYRVGLACIGSWEDEHDANMAMRIEYAEIEYLLGHFEVSEKMSLDLMEHARTPIERADVCRLLVWQFTLEMKFENVFRWGFAGLRALGISIPEDGNLVVFLDAEMASIERHMAGRAISELIDLPAMTEPTVIAALRLLVGMLPAAYMSNQALHAVFNAKLANLSITYGHCPESATAYSSFGMLLVYGRGDFRTGYEYGMLAWQLAKRGGHSAQICKNGVNVGAFIVPWVEHVQASMTFFDEGYRAGLDAGELQWAGYNLQFKTMLVFHSGEPLAKVKDESYEDLLFYSRTRNAVGSTFVEPILFPVLNLLGETDSDVTFAIGETDVPAWLKKNESKKTQITCLYVGLAQALYVHGKVDLALVWCRKAEELLTFVRGLITSAVHTLFYGLCLLDTGGAGDPVSAAHIEMCRAKLARWAKSSPANFRHMHAILEAAAARVAGDPWRALTLLDGASRSANKQGFRQYAALACELAGKLLIESGQHEMGLSYIAAARDGYRAWGAKRKVMQLDRIDSHEPQAMRGRDSRPSRSPAWSSSGNLDESVDLMAIAKASQAISSEVELERVFGALLEMCLASAGAETAVLVLAQDKTLSVVGRARAFGEVEIRPMPLAECPELVPAVVHYVARTGESRVLHDAASDPTFGRDETLRRRAPKSVLCVPVMRGGVLVGILYLENNQTTNAFTVSRVRVLQVLAAQAAISLDNARLYSELKENNEKLTVALQAARESARLKTKFLANTSHELRTPLNAIVNIPNGLAARLSERTEWACTACDLVLARAKDESEAPPSCPSCAAQGSFSKRSICLYRGRRDDAVGYLRVVQSNGEQLIGLVEDLLDMSRLDAERMRIDPIELDAQDAAREVVDKMRGLGEKRKVRVTLHPEGLVPRLRADYGRLQQVLINLVDNAIKFSGEGSTVVVGVQHDREGFALFTVHDEGIGIAHHEQEKIFESFYQVDGTNTRHAGGAGLGLAICREIVHLHGGEIWVESTPGRGSTFYVRLPCIEEVKRAERA
ncbi:AAA family ATPase [Pendulispora rubella]|uniref:histidine kinase n=1 Tax=Pendulispora rubella TaxID=2741070 RepID=A0ABZ2L7G4_9BACT